MFFKHYFTSVLINRRHVHIAWILFQENKIIILLYSFEIRQCAESQIHSRLLQDEGLKYNFFLPIIKGKILPWAHLVPVTPEAFSSVFTRLKERKSAPQTKWLKSRRISTSFGSSIWIVMFVISLLTRTGLSLLYGSPLAARRDLSVRYVFSDLAYCIIYILLLRFEHHPILKLY